MSLRKAGIIVVGDEILSGKIKDENIYFLCQRFQDLGVKVDKIITVGDNINDISEEVQEFSINYDLVIVSGGVGPTHDDVTYEAVASAFSLDLEINETLLLFWKEDPKENEASIKKMSTVPKSSQIKFVEISDCKNVYIVNIKNVYMFPGTPQTLQTVFTAFEKQYFSGHGTQFYKRVIFLSVDETAVLTALNQTVNTFKDVAIGSYPEIDNPNYFTRITLHSHEESRVIDAYNMLLSLIEPGWILNPDNFSSSSNEYKSKI